MPSILSIGTAVPSFRYTREDVRRIGAEWLAGWPKELELFERFLSSSRTEVRYFSVPPDQILKLNGLERRNQLFEKHAPPLGELAINNALGLCELDHTQLQTLLFTSCSCPSIPAIDALILERVGLARTTPRIPIYQHGCAGGVVGLGLAAELSKLGKTVALTAVELCSLVFQPNKPTPAQLVGSAIFADGAACAIIVPQDEGLVIRGSQSYLVPDSRHLMGYDVFDDGFHLRLDRELPQMLARVAPLRVQEFLKSFDLGLADIDYWLFHPGGVKILDFLESTFARDGAQAGWSREILSTVGNISSATVLFVLRAFMDSKISRNGDKSLLLGVGPGLTIELVLFEQVE